MLNNNLQKSAFTPYYQYKKKSYCDLKIEVFEKIINKKKINKWSFFQKELDQIFDKKNPTYNQLLNILEIIYKKIE